MYMYMHVNVEFNVWLLGPVTSSRYSSKWLFWLLLGESLNVYACAVKPLNNGHIEIFFSSKVVRFLEGLGCSQLCIEGVVNVHLKWS